MNLIDCFNTFQDVTKSLKLSANARSLYIAILGEFNSARYPEVLGITNRVLQDMSGINSESSFHSARNALINANLIAHKKQAYKLTPEAALEKLKSRFGDDLEPTWSLLGDSLEPPKSTSHSINLKKNKKEEDEERATPAPAFFNNNMNAPEVQEMWFKCEGENIPYAMAQTLYELEKIHGVDFAKDVVFTASAENKQPKITLNYLKTIANNKLKGGEKVGKVESENWEQQRASWLGH